MNNRELFVVAAFFVFACY